MAAIWRRAALYLLALVVVAGCGRRAAPPVVTALPTATSPAVTAVAAQPTPTLLPVATALPPATPTLLPTATPAPTATSTADPYAPYTIAGLAARSYGGGLLQIESTLSDTPLFTRSVITYPSDGLTIYGFMNVPVGEGPFPVALVLHGYVPPENYAIMTYTTRYADTLAQAGYLTIHPNYRNFPPSDETEAFALGRRESDYRVGYAVDVLNLMAIVREQAGQPGPLQRADGGDIHLFGHSMGGGITLRVITVDQNVSAAVLYGAMSGDEQRNYEKIFEWSNGEVGANVLATQPDVLARISPIYHLERIAAPVSIHHGTLDDTVPPAWSDELCQLLRALQKPVECFSYADQPHTFYGDGDQLFQQRVLDFFSRH